LYDRRLRGDLIEAYKIITDKEKVKKEVFFEFSDTGYNLRGHCYKLATKRSHLEVRSNFFSQRVVGAWNLLPAHIVEAPSVNGTLSRTVTICGRVGLHKATASTPDIYKYKYKIEKGYK